MTGLAEKLPGSGPATCECGQHRQRCRFGAMHNWGKAFVDPATGRPLDRPAFHCFTCGAWCPLDDEEV